MGSGFSIRKTDNLSALADRIVYAHKMKWESLKEKTTVRYYYHFMDWFFRFPNVGDNKKYVSRMKKSLKRVILHALTSKELNLKQKIHLSVIRISPGLYQSLTAMVNFLKGRLMKWSKT